MKVLSNLFGNNSKINANCIVLKDDNNKGYTLDKKRVVLYETDSPVGTGTITLNDDIEKYEEVNITFINNDGEICATTVHNPSNKKICLKSSHAGGSTYYYIDYFAYITLSGKTGTYSEGRTLVINSNKTIFSIAACDTQKIIKIVAYK